VAFGVIDWIPLTMGVGKMVMNAKFDVSPVVMLRILVFWDAILCNGVI
jgi:hypothetical protein